MKSRTEDVDAVVPEEVAGTGLSEAADRWARDLAAWAIPDDILRGAEANPWQWPRSRLHRDPEKGSPTTRAAREGLGAGGDLLDVGVGAGWSSLHLVPPATRLAGVDSDPEMLAAFADNCRRRGIEHLAVGGVWPDVAGSLGPAAVVLSAHVVYNVAAIVPFVRALSTHARKRVVLECTARHPTAWMAPLWERFHGLRRPARPTADDLVALLGCCAPALHVERWVSSAQPADDSDMVEFVTRRLCLPATRNVEVAEALATTPRERDEVTVWWDTESQG